jgi:hypothetical protein
MLKLVFQSNVKLENPIKTHSNSEKDSKKSCWTL